MAVVPRIGRQVAASQVRTSRKNIQYAPHASAASRCPRQEHAVLWRSHRKEEPPPQDGGARERAGKE